MEEARDKGAISDETYKKLRASIMDLVEDADVVLDPPKPEPMPSPRPKSKVEQPKPRMAWPRSVYTKVAHRHRATEAKDGEIAQDDAPLDETSHRNLWRDAALAAFVIVAGILTTGWLLGDVILALTIVLALLALALIPIAQRLVEEDQSPEPPDDDRQAET